MSKTMLKFVKTMNKKEKPDPTKIAFGTHYTDHMFMMDYIEGKGWINPRVVPYQEITLDPAAMIFHYGQTVFEGLKAYRTEDNDVLLFRPEENIARLNRSSARISIPALDEESTLQYLKEYVHIERDWVPNVEGTSLYLRPFIIATEPNLSVLPAKAYTFMIIASPVGSYYKEGIAPVGIYVEDEYTRAVRGGTGTAKTAGNYAAAYKAQEKADELGYSQVLWLDGVEKKYIEEVGSMNVFFKINGEVITPKLNGSILEGITRKSVIELLRDWNIPVVERTISFEELKTAYDNGQLEEAFGTGTAAVISPIGELAWSEGKMIINERQTGALSKDVYEALTEIQTGKRQDHLNWTVKIK